MAFGMGGCIIIFFIFIFVIYLLDYERMLIIKVIYFLFRILRYARLCVIYLYQK